MRALWILFLTLFFAVQASAQITRTDSVYVSAFGENESLINNGKPKIDTSQHFYLVKSKQLQVLQQKKRLIICRQLSSEHAIVYLQNFQNLELLRGSIDYAIPANHTWKLPTSLSISNTLARQWMVVTTDEKTFRTLILQLKAKIIESYPETNTLLVELVNAADVVFLSQSNLVLFLQPSLNKPREELQVNGFDLTANRINCIHSTFPNLDGSGLVVSVKENKFDSADIDFKGRIISSPFSSNTVTSHASIMATMIAGGGNSYYLGKGVAWNSKLISNNFAQLLPLTATEYNQFHINVENHSYGTSIENFYGADAAAYDASVMSNPSLVHVFSSGNSGTAASNSGTYNGISNFANLTGSFKMAKNIITVGATDSFANVEVLSSRGPAYDGRVKPDLVAFGQDGSSGAAAIVSGTSLLIQQAFQQNHHDSLPLASLVKAALINSADEIGTPGPHYESGYGALNGERAVESVINEHYFVGEIADKSSKIYSISIPAGTRTFKATIAYSDPPAQPNSFKALVNDLDLELIETASGQTWKPWVLSNFPNKDSLQLSAVRRRDSLNNVEQISIDHPAGGNYQIKVSGYQVSNGSQPFALVYQTDSINQFEWDFPKAGNPFLAGTTQALRWHETFGGTGTLEYSTDTGTTWHLISSNVDLDRKYYKWNTPDTFFSGLLRMTAGGRAFVSDTIVFSKRIQLTVGFNCPDSVLLIWSAVKNADSYKVYALTSTFLQPIVSTTDTSLIFLKNAINSKHFTVAPMLRHVEGIKAITTNFETQGVGCYLKNFLATLVSNMGSVSLELGTVFKLKQIEIQKDNGSDFVTIQTINNPSQLAFQFNYPLHSGVNRFRTKLVLENGVVIYSGTETVYYTGSIDYIVYPNPSSVAKGFTLMRKDVDEATLLLYDLYGRQILQTALLDIINPISTSRLQRGIYLVVIVDQFGQKKFTQKVILN
jgi:hypothetical protein